MRIAVLGASGNIGLPMCERLVRQGHQVRAMTRGGSSGHHLAAIGAEPFLGTFEEAGSEPEGFFDGVDRAFTMVRTNWAVPEHYATVSRRIARMLRESGIEHVVNLSSIGADLASGAGHVSDFFAMEQAFSGLPMTVTQMRCGWFMENFFRMAGSVARHGTLATLFAPHVALPCVATRDIAAVAADLLTGDAPPTDQVREVHGSEDLTMAQVAQRIAPRIGRPVSALSIDPTRAEVRNLFLERFGTPDVWEHRVEMYEAFNKGHARFHEARAPHNTTPTTLDSFLADSWVPVYQQELATGSDRPDTFESFIAGLATLLVETRP
ncbi:NmrA family NAD(P)-binding protein (plasmid) [Sphingobium limneticum]|uniref:NmrA family NAD(P)-binding protein n=1 Tax=Nitrobacter sp. TaxID=29420 RepID=UPI000F7B4466|nr:NmrA family NAD(P)-binding protein [Nitrobacter sp.]QEH80913.1 NAD(P)H-binding protein [Sphingomonas sp. C8-2]